LSAQLHPDLPCTVLQHSSSNSDSLRDHPACLCVPPSCRSQKLSVSQPAAGLSRSRASRSGGAEWGVWASHPKQLPYVSSYVLKQ